MMNMKVNKFGIGYFTVNGSTFKEKMKMTRIFCDDCNHFITDDEDVMVIPFLNSAYCKECGSEYLETCKAVDKFEVKYGISKEMEFQAIFNSGTTNI